MTRNQIMISLSINNDMINNYMHRNDNNTIMILFKRRKQLKKLLKNTYN